ncbi:NAD(P)/FAD-dependent oxidoreductase [Sphingorhabdus sp.]|uniref:NAD(P)/FAD-dependent oxidoreductase n=1 Tax=Sphingorhabdus sp. TaxID=1902408 RepID=UPI0039838BED
MSVTVPRDLRTGRTIWLDRRLPHIPKSQLGRSASCDVLVIGAGISGSIIAEALSDAGLQVALVDRRGPLQGSTAASTALLQYEIDTPLSVLGERIGRDRAERLWRRSRLAVDALRQRTRVLGIDANQATRDSLYLSGNVLDAAGLEAETLARKRAGFEVTFLKPPAVFETYGIKGRSAIVGRDNYMADPRLLAAGYLNAAISRGARLYAPVEVTDISASHSGVVVSTSDGPEIKARHLVFATGYEMPKGVPRKGNKIISTWAISTKPQPRNIWPTGSIIWEASDPYLYIRTTPEGHVICGGEDAEIADAEERDALNDEKTQALVRKLGGLLPMIDPTATHSWSGSFGDSKTGTPTIGPVPRMPNCYAAMGYGGNGITFSMMAGQMLRGMISGVGDADSDLVSFTRRF